MALLFRVNARNAEAWLSGAIALASLLIAATFYPEVAGGDVIRSELEWLPAHGLTFALRLDGYAWMFAMLVTGIGLSSSSMRAKQHVAAGPGAALLLLSARIHGRECLAWCCPAT